VSTDEVIAPVAPAIVVANVSKTFRIYRSRESTLKETILRRNRGV
jgi:hypothetical protein